MKDLTFELDVQLVDCRRSNFNLSVDGLYRVKINIPR